MPILRTATLPLLITCVIAIAVQQAAASQTVTQSKAAPSSIKSSEIARFFPLRVGNRWVYRVRGAGTGANGRTVRVSGSYSDTVVNVEMIGSAQLVDMRREGNVHPHILCDTEANKSDRFWFIISKDRLYATCSKDEAAKLIQTLDENSSQPGSDDSMEFLLPFVVGTSWGANHDLPSRNDGLYQWNVESKEVTAPHTRYHDCYTLSYRTMPDDEERKVCAGVGLVYDRYNHHGTVDEYEIELVRFVKGNK